MTASDEPIIRALESISDQLRTLIRLAAATQTEGLNQKQTVERLGRIGLDARTISEVSGHPITSVAPTLSRLNKSRRPQRTRRTPSPQEAPHE